MMKFDFKSKRLATGYWLLAAGGWRLAKNQC
jgi:hypothetical protein